VAGGVASSFRQHAHCPSLQQSIAWAMPAGAIIAAAARAAHILSFMVSSADNQE
jgi:hypothetical protein